MNPFNNPMMYEQMKNANPDMMKTAAQQMNNMSDDDLKRMGQQSGMNFSPEMMRMASSMFSNMDDKQRTDMFNMAQNMNPNLKKNTSAPPTPQASSNNTNKSSTTKANTPVQPPVDNSLFPSINSLKNKGNEKFKAQDWDAAGSLYLEAIISIEEEKMKSLSSNQERELREYEINCRNNYCSVKAKQQDYHSLLIQAQAVMKLDPNNIKAKFRLGQGYFGLKKYERALEYLTEAKNSSPGDNTIGDVYNQCKREVDKLKKEMEVEKKKEEDIKEQKQQPKKETKKEEKKPEPKEEQKSNKIVEEDVVIEEVKEETKLKKSAQSAPPAPSSYNNFNYNNNETEQMRNMMKNMDSKDIDSMVSMMKNMDNNTLRQMYKSKGMDLSDDQINMMKSQTTSDIIKQKLNSDAPLTPPVQNFPPPMSNDFLQNKSETIKQNQEKLKNMDDDQINNMANMMKGMDNSVLKSVYKSQGMDLSDEQINMMKSMMTPEMIKTASSMNPDEVMRNQPPQFSSNNNTSSSSAVNSSDSTDSSSNLQSGNPQAAAQQMPDMSNMGSLLENSAMIETAFNMMASNPEMLRMMASQLGPNHPLGKYFQNASTEDLKSLTNKLKYLVPVIKYGYKGYKFVQRFKSTIIIIIVALLIKYFFL